MKNNGIKVKLKKGHKKLFVLVMVLLMLLECVYVYIRCTMVYDRTREEAETYGESIATNIRLSLENSVSISYVLKSLYLEYGDNFLKDFDKICARLAEENNTIGSMYFAPDAVIEYAYPDEINDSTIGFEMLKDLEQAEWAMLAIDTRNVTIAGPHRLIEGETGFIIRNPIFVDDEFVGFTIIVLKWDKFVEGILKDISSENARYRFSVWKENDEHAVTDEYGYIINSSNQEVSKDIDIRINIPNDVWHLSVEPAKGWNVWGRLLPEFGISILFMGGLIYMIYFRLKKSTEILNTIQCDELTGIYTKQVFYHNARTLIDKTPNTQYTLIVADVENFKMINGIYGENKGDEVLKYLAGIFINIIEPGELCGRLGGDQFVFLVRAKYEKGITWMRDILDAIKANAPVPNLVVKFGIYQLVDNSLSIAGMTDRALMAVKSIKRNYDKPYEHYDGPVSKKHFKIQTFESNFENAIKNEEFVVWYQPKYDACSEKIVGAEALVRWVTKEGNFISPGEFIPAFEEDGLIVRLDEYVFRKVCEAIKNRMDNNKKIFPVSVNLSRASLFHEGTIEKYKKIVSETGIPTEMVPIELTESAALHSVEIKELTNALKEAGFQLHMDDFGSGVSSLASFNILPFDVVKLDKSLVDLIGDASGDELLKHTISLAHFRYMKVVAEGVETKEQLEFLKKLSCDVIQGYYFSKPRPYEDFVDYIDKSDDGDS